MISEQERYRGCLLGLACGDAMGTTLEFETRGTFEPLTGMVGGGPFNLKPGEWTDDTSMALCLATSLIEKRGFDPADQMNRYCKWWDEGYLSCTGTCFDIGITISRALRIFKGTGDPYSGPTDPMAAGNGCIMKLAPVPMFYHPDFQGAIHYSGESSKTTHGATECIDACRLFGSMIYKALSGGRKDEILFGEHFPGDQDVALSENIQAIGDGLYRDKTDMEIKGSGYVVKSLEAALWCFYHTDNFRDAILTAVNLGDDADTTGAVCGQITGAFYGESGIPTEWRRCLAMHNFIVELADGLKES